MVTSCKWRDTQDSKSSMCFGRIIILILTLLEGLDEWRANFFFTYLDYLIFYKYWIWNFWNCSGSFNHLPKEEINKTYELLKFQINLRRGTMCKYGLADTIEIYRHCHRSLCELVRYLNGMFKLHLLMTLSACFLISLFNIYFAMFGYVATVSKKQSIKIQSKLFRSIGWNMFYIVRFLAMTTTAHFTTQQVSNIFNRIQFRKTLNFWEVSLFW